MELNKKPDAWIVEGPGKKRRIVDADKYDATSPSFWVGEKIPDGVTVTPLFKPRHPTPDGEDLSL